MARVSKRRAHDSRNIDDHLVDKTKFVELNAQDAPQTNIDWDVQQAEVHSDPVYDPGTGPKAIVRRFNFQMPPGKRTTTTEEIFDYHKKNTVIPMLWKDELELLDEPRIIAGKKGAFTIVAICSPRFVMGVRSHIHEDAELVHNIINDSTTNTDKLH
jgi:hypothetical protein